MAEFVLLDEVEKKIEKDRYLIMRNSDCGWYYGLIDNDIYKAVESCKQYEFEPPKKAKWLETRDGNKKRCSNCDFIFMIATYPACSADFCPHCGARMDKE
jgi:hypothetical protein